MRTVARSPSSAAQCSLSHISPVPTSSVQKPRSAVAAASSSCSSFSRIASAVRRLSVTSMPMPGRAVGRAVRATEHDAAREDPVPADVAVQHAAHRLADRAVTRFVARRAWRLRLVQAGLGLGEIDGMHPHHPARDFATLPVRQVEHGRRAARRSRSLPATRSMSHTPTRAAFSVSSSSRWRSYAFSSAQIPLADHLREELERYGDEDEKRLDGEGVLVLRHVGERPAAVHRAEDGEQREDEEADVHPDPAEAQRRPHEQRQRRIEHRRARVPGVAADS